MPGMRRALGRALSAAAGVLFLPAAATAAGMPQLDFKNSLTLAQVGWGAVIFLVFFLLSWRWGLPQVSRVLEQRAATIANDLEAAHSQKSEADAAVEDMRENTAHARAEAQNAINAAVDKAKQASSARAAALNERLEGQLHEAEQRIAAARGDALKALRQVATETANTVIARLTGSPPEPARVERAIGNAMAARGHG